MVIVLLPIGCADKSKPYVHIQTYNCDYNYETVVIEGCQYIYIPNGQAAVMSHKGNCNNPVHQYRIEQ